MSVASLLRASVYREVHLSLSKQRLPATINSCCGRLRWPRCLNWHNGEMDINWVKSALQGSGNATNPSVQVEHGKSWSQHMSDNVPLHLEQVSIVNQCVRLYKAGLFIPANLSSLQMEVNENNHISLTWGRKEGSVKMCRQFLVGLCVSRYHCSSPDPTILLLLLRTFQPRVLCSASLCW